MPIQIKFHCKKLYLIDKKFVYQCFGCFFLSFCLQSLALPTSFFRTVWADTWLDRSVPHTSLNIGISRCSVQCYGWPIIMLNVYCKRCRLNAIFGWFDCDYWFWGADTPITVEVYLRLIGRFLNGKWWRCLTPVEMPFEPTLMLLRASNFDLASANTASRCLKDPPIKKENDGEWDVEGGKRCAYLKWDILADGASLLLIDALDEFFVFPS